MRELVSGKAFRKDLKRLHKRNKDMAKLEHILHLLRSDADIPAKYRPHRLTGNYYPYWDLHIEPDWLLIYQKYDNILGLQRTGTHSDLF